MIIKMKIPENKQYVLFGGTFLLANKLQLVADKMVHGLSTKQWFLMRNLQDMPKEPPPTVTMLAKQTDTTRQNVSKMLEPLVRQGYISLSHNPQDNRSQIVEISPGGAVALKKAAADSGPFFAQLFAGVSPQECEAAALVVIKLIDNLYKMQENGGEGHTDENSGNI